MCLTPDSCNRTDTGRDLDQLSLPILALCMQTHKARARCVRLTLIERSVEPSLTPIKRKVALRFYEADAGAAL
jgi:hypothetical protein